MKLVVDDAGELWNLAAKRCLDWTSDEIDETIGPREDPSIEDCLAMVALPAPIAGCRMIDVALRKAGRPGAELRSGEYEVEPRSFSLRIDAPHLGGAPHLSGDDGASGLIWRS
ncbi:hypothetical protein [Sphingomonas cavernae]|uniref:Uncharacterized protein n=1 Tax=Sphingomonas cavernae TaxID=2320861 RepID=A0A418W6T6_9SPHN|nr:hypothetical protein [Sphingomonas cavernae]RJF85751.1 hypothetical protein D3876_17870 [Sphingomonas cavernae]